jgi:PAS domain S-box-containing protein
MEDRLTFPQIIEGLSAPVATITPDGRVDLVSRQLLDYLGMSVEELRDWDTPGAVHPDDLAGVVAARRLSLERGEPHEVEYRLRRADGVYRWTHVRRLPFRAAEDRIVRWRLFFTDIHERKRSEAILNGEKRLLELVASGAALEGVLEEMCHIEK